MEELDLKELLQMFWEKKIQIILITAIFMVLGAIYSLAFVTPKYESKTKLLLATNSSADTTTTTGSGTITTTDVTLNSKLVSTYSVLVKSDKIIRNVISNLALDVEEDEIRNNVSVNAVADTEVIEIKVKNEDPIIAMKVTNEIAKVFIENVKEFYGIANVHVVDVAETAQNPYNINHPKNIIIFGAIGIVIAALYIIVLNMLDTTIKSVEDIEKITRRTVLVAIPMYDMTENKTKVNRRKGGKK